MESVGVGLLHSKPGTGRELQKRGEKIRKDSLFREYGEEDEEEEKKTRPRNRKRGKQSRIQSFLRPATA